MARNITPNELLAKAGKRKEDRQREYTQGRTVSPSDLLRAAGKMPGEDESAARQDAINYIKQGPTEHEVNLANAQQKMYGVSNEAYEAADKTKMSLMQMLMALAPAAAGRPDVAVQAVKETKARNRKQALMKNGVPEEKATELSKDWTSTQTAKGIVDRNEYDKEYAKKRANLSAEEDQLFRTYVESKNTAMTAGIPDRYRMNAADKQIAARDRLQELGWDTSSKEFMAMAENYQYLTDEEKANAQKEEFRKEVKDSTGTAILANVESALLMPARGTAALESLRPTVDSRAGVNTNSSLYAFSNMDEAITEATNEKIDEAVAAKTDSEFLRWAAKMGYNVTKSTVESLYSMYLGGAVAGELGATGKAAEAVRNLVTLPAFGTTAYAQTVSDAQERGLSKENAVKTGLAAGVAEMLFEQISLDKAWSAYAAHKMGQVGVKKTIMSLLAGAGIEGSEEGFTDIANWLSDYMINHDFSEFGTRVAQYEASGLSSKEAEKMVRNEYLKELRDDVIAGAASGFLINVGSSAAGSVNYHNLAKETESNPELKQNLLDAAKADLKEDTTAYQIASQKAAEDVSTRELAQVIQSMSEVAQNGTEGVLQTAFEKMGETEEQAQEHAQRLMAVLQQEESEITEESEQNLSQELERDENLSNVMGQVVRGEIGNSTRVLDEVVNGPAVQNTNEQVLRRDQQAVSRFAQTLEDDHAQKAMEDNYKGQNPAVYAELSARFYNQGRIGATSFEKLMSDERTQAKIALLGDNTHLKMMYDLGYNAAQAGQQALPAQLNLDNIASQKITLGEAIDNRSVKMDDALMNFAKVVAKTVGVNVMLSDGSGNENGHFVAGLGQIVIADNGGKAIPALAHELGEFGKAYAPEKMKQLVQTILDFVNTTKGAEHLTKTLENYQRVYRQVESGKTIEQAGEEYAFDYLGGILASEDGMQEFMEYVTQKYEGEERKSIMQTVSDIFRKIADVLHRFLSGKDGMHMEPGTRDALESAEQKARDFVKMFGEVLDEASENLRKQAAGEKVKTEKYGKQKNSMKVSFESQIDEITEKTFDTNSYIFVMENLPKIYQEYAGWEDSPVLMSYVKARISMDEKNDYSDHCHNLGDAIMKQIPNAMEAPTKILIMPNGRINAILPLMDKKNRQILISMEMDKGKYINKKYGNVDKDNQVILVTAFGAKPNYLKKLENDGKLIFPQNKTSSAVHEGSQRANPSSKDVLVKNNVTQIQEKSSEKKSFSLSVPVEETKDLIALHNLSETNLIRTLELGGFPMPSIAVVKKDIGHVKFGDISVVFRKKTIDPQNRKNKVYGADAWTPEFPTIDYEPNKDLIWEIQKKYGPYVEQLPDTVRDTAYRLLNSLDDKLEREGGFEGLVDRLKRDYAMKELFLATKGQVVPDQIKETRTELTPDQKENARYAVKYLEGNVSDILKEGRKAVLENHGDEIKRGIAEYFAKDLNIPYDESLEMVNEFKGIEIIRMLYNARLLQENGGVTVNTEYDVDTQHRMIDERVDAAEYDAWLRNMLDGIEKDKGVWNGKDRFLPSGNRRSFSQLHNPVTAENIVKAMLAQSDNVRNTAGFNGAKSVRAVAVEDFRNIQAIKNASRKMKDMSAEEFSAIEEDLDNRLLDIIHSIMEDSGQTEWRYVDYVGESILDTARKNLKTTQQVIDEFGQYSYKVSEKNAQAILDIIDEIRNMPVNMFEAKPQRVVGFDEIANVVLPDDASKQLIGMLDERAIPHVDYPAGDMEARKNAVNATENIAFSLPVYDSDGRALSEGQQAFFADSKVRDEDGNLLRMYHGTPTGDFTIFHDGLEFFSADRDYASRYEDPSASSRKSGKNKTSAKTFEVYLNIKKPFDIRNAQTRKLFIEDYVKGGYALGINPYVEYMDTTNTGLPSWEEADNIYEWMEDTDRLDQYDGIVVDEGGYPGPNGEVVSRGIAYVTFHPEQVKNVTNENPTDDPDIRYSIDVWDDVATELDEYYSQQEELISSILQEGIEAANNVTVDEKRIAKIAKSILQQTSSTYGLDRLTNDLKNVFAYLKDTGSGSHEDLVRVMKEIAKPVLEMSQGVDTAMKDEYLKARDYFKGKRIRLTTTQQQEVKNEYGSIQRFRGLMFGHGIIIANNGSSLDGMWEEMVDQLKGWLDPGANEGAMPGALEKAMAAMKPTKQNSLFEGDLEANAYDLAMDIFREYFMEASKKENNQKLREKSLKMTQQQKEYRQEMMKRYRKEFQKATDELRAEKKIQIARLAEEINELSEAERQALQEGDTINQALFQAQRERYEKRLAQLRESNEAKLAKVKAQNTYSRYKASESRKNTELKAYLRKNIDQLNSMLAHPTEKKHVPADMVKAVIDVLTEINVETGSQSVKEKLDRLQAVYGRYKADSTFTQFDYDERTAEDIKTLKRLFNGKSYASLSNDELRQVIDIVTALKKQISNANKLIENEKLEDAKEASAEAQKEVYGARKTENKLLNALDWYTGSHLNAYRFFRKTFGYADGAGMAMYKQLDDGQMKMIGIQREINDLFNEVLDGKENQKEVQKLISTKEEDLVDVGFRDKEGNPVKVTRAMRLAMIMHSKSPSNMRHLLGGGVTVPDMELFRQGKIKEAYAKGQTFRLVNHEQMLAAIRSKKVESVTALQNEARRRLDLLEEDLSEYEKRFLACAQDMFWNYTGRKVNETSMQLKGYALARVKNYFPIRTDANFIATDYSGLIRDGSLEGMGMLKERTVSQKPILLEDITNAITRQTQNVSMYAGLAVPIRNLNMLLNATFYDEGGDPQSLKKAIKQTWGARNEEWIQHLMQDLQGGRRQDRTFMDTLRSRFAGATLTLNPSVAIKQAASYPTAAAVVGWKPLMKAMTQMGKGFVRQQGLEELEKRNPLLWYRNLGNSTQELGDIRQSKDFGSRLPGFLNWIQWMDTGTVRTLEYASMFYVDANTNLKKGSAEYWDKVSETFSKVVQETQPNYTVLQQADIIRDPNKFIKQLFMFKTQPMQNFGILYDAAGNLNAQMKKGSKDQIREAKRDFAKAVSSQIVSALTFSTMTILANLLLHKQYKYKDDEDKLSAEEILKALGQGMMSNFAGMLIAGSEVYDLIHSIITGDTYYGVDVSTVEMINDLAENTKTLVDQTRKFADAVTEADQETARFKMGKAAWNLFKAAGQFAGIPLGNSYNIFDSIYLYAKDVISGEPLGSSENKQLSDIATQYERILQAAVEGNEARYDELVDQMVQTGKEESNVQSQVKTKLKEAYLNGEVDEQTASDVLEDRFDMTDDEAYLQIMKWDNGADSQYIEVQKAIDAAIESGKSSDRKAIQDAINDLVNHGVEKSKIKANVTSKYKQTYLDLKAKNQAADMKNLLISVYMYLGDSKEEASKKIDKWSK